MKFLTERIETVDTLIEDAGNGKKNHYIQGVFLMSEIKNRNGRIYPKSVLGKEVDRYIKEQINSSAAVGELGHPDTPTINYDRVSHKILSLKEDGNNFIGKAKILDTPSGKIVKTLIDEGVRIGTSSRGVGSLKSMNEANIVQDDFRLATAGDIVHDPSAPEAFMTGIMEGREWVYDIFHDKWELIENVEKEIKKARKNDLENIEFRLFEQLLRKL